MNGLTCMSHRILAAANPGISFQVTGHKSRVPEVHVEPGTCNLELTPECPSRPSRYE